MDKMLVPNVSIIRRFHCTSNKIVTYVDAVSYNIILHSYFVPLELAVTIEGGRGLGIDETECDFAAEGGGCGLGTEGGGRVMVTSDIV